MKKLAFLLLLSGAILLVSCYPFGADGSWEEEATLPNTTTTIPSTISPTVVTANGTTAVIMIDNIGFNPTTLIVTKGTTVTWTNKNSIGHRVTEDKERFASGNLGLFASFTWTFNESGNYTYHCGNHPALKGTIIVK